MVAARRRKLKALLVEYKGTSCERCGFIGHQAAMVFHHKDPLIKEFAISKHGHTMSLDKAKAEVDKCHLLCSNCHLVVHAIDDPKWIALPS